ncbi:glutaredoxin family protein [Gilvimarinus sp. F26214L]|uniref:glutaredoxin family protein n=1 Tax=Gilvimarinus sp. DZF01 TaxID=3461371 RepID=UPI0040453E23
MKTIILYSTLGCHLCEQARALMHPVLEAAGYQLEERDIAESEELLERYKFTIPVAYNPRNGREINWPFGVEQVADLLV